MQLVAAPHSETDDAEKTSVDIQLLEIKKTNIGPARAYAAVEMVVAEITFILQGIVVVQDRRRHCGVCTRWHAAADIRSI